MKKKFLALFLATLLCLTFTIPCFAESKPSVEAMYVSFSTNSAGGVSPKIYYRNNSGKTIKYIDWLLAAYNRVGDPVSCRIKGHTIALARTTGPINPFNQTLTPFSSSTDSSVPNDNPFKTYSYTFYNIASNGTFRGVYIDKYGNPFAYNGSSLIQSNDGYAYLTDDEISNALFKDSTEFNVCWYNSSIASVKVMGAIITYMDDSTEKIIGDQINSPYKNIQNKPFKALLNEYSPVYNYKDYLQYNPDLRTVFGENQKALFEHFINSGMKEGRQGCSKFNLDIYKSSNSDLVEAFGDDNVKYYEHYISSGNAEGRKAA